MRADSPDPWVFQPAEPAGLKVAGQSARFPVRRVFCVGRNYAAHAREMGSDPDREPPFFFCKPGDARSVVSCPAGQVIDLPYPPATQNYHFEVEWVLALGAKGRDLSVDQAQKLIWGHAVGLDLTRRDLQNAAKANGRPWETGKAHDFSAPIGELMPVSSSFAGPARGAAIVLDRDAQRCQEGTLDQMTWSAAEIVSRLSSLFELHPGDLIFTGTPEGVGPVERGQLLTAQIEGLPPLAVRLV